MCIYCNIIYDDILKGEYNITLRNLNDYGIFKLMPNGFNIYNYETKDNITDDYFELMDKEVRAIGSDPMGEIEVPAIFVIV